MAKRKKKSTHRRPRRMSGAGSGNLKMVAGVVGGAVVGRFVGSMLSSKMSLSPTITNAVMIGGGIFLLPKVMKGPMGTAIGAGIAAQAAVALLQSTGVLSGTSDFKVILPPPQNQMSGGLSNMKTLSGGLANLNAVSGNRPRLSGNGGGYPKGATAYHPGMG